MNILFVSSANRFNLIDSLVENQAISLSLKGVKITHFLIRSKGFFGYLKSVLRLRKIIEDGNFALVHAHYGLCGFVSLLASGKVPVIVSFMGSDLHGGKVVDFISFVNYFVNKSTAILQQYICKRVIIKSDSLRKYLFLPARMTITIPNGVNLEEFKAISRSKCCKMLNLDINKRYVLFLGRLDDPNKNYLLFKKALQIINSSKIIALIPYPVAPELIMYYLNAVEAFVFTSYKEGSPNTIKEAMACNCPIVSTNVGDVQWVLGDTMGCYISTFEPMDVAKKINLALAFAQSEGRTTGRERLISLGLDSETVAQKIIDVYNKVLNPQF